jgi:xanthine dehydrogenase accessory factor
MTDFFDKVAALAREGQAFAVATVVGRRPPVSAHLGDKAIVFADGRMEGFVGGACAREIVRKQALECVRGRTSRLVSIRPDAIESTTDPEHVIVPMTCASEGAVDVYVEAFVQPRRLVIVGLTPVAEALARTAATMNYDVVRVVLASEQADVQLHSSKGLAVAPLESLDAVLAHGRADVAAVVASQGHYDEESLDVILKSDTSYVGLVASRKRGEQVRAWLEERGHARASEMRSPAGLDLGARTAPEVALSILAEIVQAAPRHRAAVSKAEAPRTAVDPVCGMDVEVATARHSAEVDGTTYYFCCAQCQARFVKNPQSFLTTRA